MFSKGKGKENLKELTLKGQDHKVTQFVAQKFGNIQLPLEKEKKRCED